MGRSTSGPLLLTSWIDVVHWWTGIFTRLSLCRGPLRRPFTTRVLPGASGNRCLRNCVLVALHFHPPLQSGVPSGAEFRWLTRTGQFPMSLRLFIETGDRKAESGDGKWEDLMRANRYQHTVRVAVQKSGTIRPVASAPALEADTRAKYSKIRAADSIRGGASTVYDTHLPPYEEYLPSSLRALRVRSPRLFSTSRSRVSRHLAWGHWSPLGQSHRQRQPAAIF